MDKYKVGTFLKYHDYGIDKQTLTGIILEKFYVKDWGKKKPQYKIKWFGLDQDYYYKELEMEMLFTVIGEDNEKYLNRDNHCQATRSNK